MTTTTLDVTIMGQSYTLACPADEQPALLAAVREVDQEMCAIRDMGKVRARERIAVLAALNLAHSLLECQRDGGHSKGSPQLPAADAGAVEQMIQKLDDTLGAEGKLF